MKNATIERRRFLGTLTLTSTAAAAAALACQSARATPTPPVARQAPPTDEWSRVRAEFELAPDWLHFAGFLLASHPRRVREAIEAHRKALDQNPALYLEQRMFDDKQVLEPIANYMGVKTDEIALTDSTTMGLATLYAGLPLAPRDHVLTTDHDHYSTHESLRLACQRTGASLTRVPLYERAQEANVAAMTRAIELGLTENTRLVAITWVHSSTGVKTPVREIAGVLARVNQSRAPAERILLCVDGVHGFGIEDVTMAELGCDFFVAGTHKWMFGPRGTGLIWGKAEHWPKLRPTIPHFGMAAYRAWMEGVPAPATSADMMTPGGFHSFEHRWALGEAFEFHLAIGKSKIAQRIHELNRSCKDSLLKMKHVTLHTPLADDVSSGIITFEVAGLDPKAVVERLHQKRIVASTTPYRQSYARLAPGLCNNESEIATVLREIQGLA